MRRLFTAALAACLLMTPSATAVAGSDPGQGPTWVTQGDSARVTSCTAGNSGAIYGAYPHVLGTRISGNMRFCRDEGARYFGIEFFTRLSGHGAAGYFFGYLGDSVEWNFIGNDFENVTALCVSPARGNRVACASVQVDVTGAVSLRPMPVTDPLVAAASGAMYYCEHGTVINPTCATCV